MIGTSGVVLFLAGLVALVVVVVLALRAVIRPGRTSPGSAVQFHALAEEHRRMSERAVTAAEQVELRLADLSARVDDLRSQAQRILTDVE
jgi:TolA-binding protein